MFTTALCAALFIQIPTPCDLPEGLEQAQVEMLIQVNENHFAIHNLSSLPQVLVVGEEELGATGAARVEPGESLIYPFPRGAADALLFDVIALASGTWRNTGALEVARVRQSDGGSLWIQNAQSFSLGWTSERGELKHERPVTGLLPAALIAAHSGLQDYEALASAHVPVPIPVDDKKGGGPPVVEDEVLPPV
jgi:hypothetical protein